jgi:hypothetical protein
MGMLKGLKRVNGKAISVGATLLFLAMVLMIIFSNRYMEKCSNLETATQQKRIELYNLAESLATASDYLTDEARKFAVNGDITYLYNYWYEVYENKSRDTVIDRISSYELLDDEKVLLSRAKAYSDSLISTETLSMKLVLLSQGKTEKSYPYDEKLYEYIQQVESYQLPEEYEKLTPTEMGSTAIKILYDNLYSQYKDYILSPIDEFQVALDTRLDTEVAQSVESNRVASNVQVGCSILFLVFVAGLLFTLEWLYVRPINRYAKDISNSSKDLSKLRVKPKGSIELYEFGKTFNELSETLSTKIENLSIAENSMRIAKEQAERVTIERSRFFASMSHEFRTPLNAIVGYLYLLRDTHLSGIQDKYCKSIDVATEELLGLINNILDFSKIDNGSMSFELSDFNLTELLNGVHSLMDGTATQKGITLDLEVDNSVPTYVHSDALKLRQVLINLVGNAIKFTSQGWVKVSVKCVENRTGTALVEFSVSDSGTGIKPKDIENIFKPFKQGNSNSYGGTGLGLPISQRIVKALSDGKYSITVDSTEGKGSRFAFCLDLPIAKPLDTSDSTESKKLVKFSSSDTILLVDDSSINLDIESQLLKKSGVSVITAQSGSKAIDTLKSTKVSMVLLDLHMPHMDGYQTAQNIRKIDSCKDIPIVALTADVTSNVVEKVKLSGMDYCISKPIKPDRLRHTLKKYLKCESVSTTSSGGATLFDYQRCMENLNGNRAILNDLVNRFISEHSTKCYMVRKYVSIGNYINARKLLHDIVGLSGNLCCDSLHGVASKLLQELRNETFESLEEFTTVWKDTIQTLKDYVSTNGITGRDASANEKLSKLTSLCQSYDISAIEYFANHREYFCRMFTSSEVKALEQHLKRYDFQWVLENL